MRPPSRRWRWKRAPDVVVATGLADNGWVTIDPPTLATKFPGVYAGGDLADTGAPKAGVFAESGARTVAANLIALLREQERKAKNPGAGTCFIEFGANRIGRVDIDFFSGPKITGTFPRRHVPASMTSARRAARAGLAADHDGRDSRAHGEAPHRGVHIVN